MNANLRGDVRMTGVTIMVVLTMISCLGVVSGHGLERLPKGWPGELMPFVRGAQVIDVGEVVQEDICVVPFDDREVFEEAWPLILKVKSPGAPLKLYRVGQKTGTGPFTYTKEPNVAILGPTDGMVQHKNGKRLHTGPPWPDSVRNKDGTLPEYAVATEETWVPAEPGDRGGQRGFLNRVRVEIELVVDGKVIDLNRIPLPADTPIIDCRWPKTATQPASRPSRD